MKSSTNQYFIGLDHLRAIAALMVFCWHFIHANGASGVPYSYSANFPLASLFNEGHVGVSLFMVLSGYLFAKIIASRQIDLPKFYLNRFLRLAPLMIFVTLINAIIRWLNGEPSIWYFIASLVNGLIHPSLPNGGWSITVEFHFYLLLPLLLWMKSRSQRWLIVLLVGALIGRYLYFLEHGSVSYLAYWTIIGRLDLFVLGILAYTNSQLIRRTWLALVAVAGFALSYWYFDSIGGFKGTQASVLWVFWAMLEGFFLCVLVANYDAAARNFNGPVSRAIATIGKVSYSMYLMHIFFVFALSQYIHTNIMSLSNFYVALGFSLLAYLLLVPVAWLSYHCVEKPFLSLRVNYFKTD